MFAYGDVFEGGNDILLREPVGVDEDVGVSVDDVTDESGGGRIY